MSKCADPRMHRHAARALACSAAAPSQETTGQMQIGSRCRRPEADLGHHVPVVDIEPGKGFPLCLRADYRHAAALCQQWRALKQRGVAKFEGYRSRAELRGPEGTWACSERVTQVGGGTQGDVSSRSRRRPPMKSTLCSRGASCFRPWRSRQLHLLTGSAAQEFGDAI